MQSDVAVITRTTSEQVLVWLDFGSVAQRNPCAQAMAISALPAYVSLADRFIICAPDARHRDTKEFCGLNTYSLRGWCRMEMFAKACCSGLEHMYLQLDSASELTALTIADLGNLSLHVFEGVFTEPRDMEKLVEPALGLYSLVLKRGSTEKFKSIRHSIELSKDRFFPATYSLQEAGCRRQLFGNLNATMEEPMREEVSLGEVLPERSDLPKQVSHELADVCRDTFEFEDVCLPEHVHVSGSFKRAAHISEYVVPDAGDSVQVDRSTMARWPTGCCFFSGTCADHNDEIVFDDIVLSEGGLVLRYG